MAISAIMRLREKRRNSHLKRIRVLFCRRIARYQRYRREQQKSLEKMVVQSTIYDSIKPTVAQRKLWSKPRNDNWWYTIVKQQFDESDWVKKFRISKGTFYLLCHELHSFLHREDTILRKAIPVDRRVAVLLWRLATNAEYRTISHKC